MSSGILWGLCGVGLRCKLHSDGRFSNYAAIHISLQHIWKNRFSVITQTDKAFIGNLENSADLKNENGAEKIAIRLCITKLSTIVVSRLVITIQHGQSKMNEISLKFQVPQWAWFGQKLFQFAFINSTCRTKISFNSTGFQKTKFTESNIFEKFGKWV